MFSCVKEKLQHDVSNVFGGNFGRSILYGCFFFNIYNTVVGAERGAVAQVTGR